MPDQNNKTRKTEEKEKTAFKGCRSPDNNTDFCLLADYRKDGIGGGNQDYQLALGHKEVSAYLSEISEDTSISDPVAFLPEMTEKDMRRILSRYNVVKGTVTLCICDIGSGGGIKKVYSQSRRFNFE